MTPKTIPPSIAEEFLTRKLPEKEPLVKGLLYRRDLVSLIGRRRHGKTTLMTNLAVGLAAGCPSLFGYPIPKAARALILYLEDDSGELQTKLRKVVGHRQLEGRLAVFTREDFYQAHIPTLISSPDFIATLRLACQSHRPDVLILDNLGFLLGADFNNAPAVHGLVEKVAKLSSEFNCAVIIAVHPRKRPKESSKSDVEMPKLSADSDLFYEEAMGSSHFVNSTGSVWMIERDVHQTNRTIFVGGQQRVSGEQSGTILEKSEDDWLEVIGDVALNKEQALTTPTRKAAWALLPELFTFEDGGKAVHSVIKSRSAWWSFFDKLQQVKLITPLESSAGYRKVTI